MREILFRGKPKNKEHFCFFSEIWKEHCEDGFVYGSLIVDKDRCFIAVSAQCSIKSCVNNGIVSMIEVIPETIGQYTGLTDKNDKKIFEGDIIKFCKGLKLDYIVEFDSGSFVLSRYDAQGEIIDVYSCACEVIGNIHDNPELLKVGEKK